MINVKEILEKAIEHGASDVHTNATMPPIMRINTELTVIHARKSSSSRNARSSISPWTPTRFT